MKTVIIIPARYASTRLNAKPLIKVGGKPVIQWVYEQAKTVKAADEVIVATDNQEIFDTVKGFGGMVEMTSTEHKSGTDRIAEVISRHSEYENVFLTKIITQFIFQETNSLTKEKIMKVIFTVI